ncbi:MAG: GDSL-type esterase/lipase family protein, partial [Candidatus Latescibacteria bacterium]|nr:GDSL-type esterase/lipase family protein [Candidatus Latescibacterota bacterium]
MPELNLKVMQFGWSGERAPGLVNRIENDLIPWKPDVITTCYGMNDGRYRKYEDSIGQTYRENMLKIVDRLKETGATVVVGSPGAVDTYTYERTARQRLTTAAVYNENLAQLRDIAKSIAKEKDMPFADIHMALMIAMKKA